VTADFKFVLAGLPPRYRDSVRAITPGLPLFLYNYTTHQLHGIFEVSNSFLISLITVNFVGSPVSAVKYYILGLFKD
jgi:hypothetical protein